MEKVSRPMCRSLATKANPPLRHFAQGVGVHSCRCVVVRHIQSSCNDAAGSAGTMI
eukprot:COSAG01_NODE_58889_length_303_cov_0.990196_1_plen_55_part_01